MVESYELDIQLDVRTYKHPHIDIPHEGAAAAAAPCCRESKFALSAGFGNGALRKEFTSPGSLVSKPGYSLSVRDKRTSRAASSS